MSDEPKFEGLISVGGALMCERCLTNLFSPRISDSVIWIRCIKCDMLFRIGEVIADV